MEESANGGAATVPRFGACAKFKVTRSIVPGRTRFWSGHKKTYHPEQKTDTLKELLIILKKVKSFSP